MNLDELIADSLERAKKPKTKKRSSRPEKGDAYAQTKEELRKLQLDACEPVSVHLRVTNQQCECGEVYHAVNTVPLVKCVGKNLTHFRPEENANDPKYWHLPRVIEVHTVDIPYCETCFVNASYVHVQIRPR